MCEDMEKYRATCHARAGWSLSGGGQAEMWLEREVAEMSGHLCIPESLALSCGQASVPSRVDTSHQWDGRRF